MVCAEAPQPLLGVMALFLATATRLALESNSAAQWFSHLAALLLGLGKHKVLGSVVHFP